MLELEAPGSPINPEQEKNKEKEASSSRSLTPKSPEERVQEEEEKKKEQEADGKTAEDWIKAYPEKNQFNLEPTSDIPPTLSSREFIQTYLKEKGNPVIPGSRVPIAHVMDYMASIESKKLDDISTGQREIYIGIFQLGVKGELPGFFKWIESQHSNLWNQLPEDYRQLVKNGVKEDYLYRNGGKNLKAQIKLIRTETREVTPLNKKDRVLDLIFSTTLKSANGLSFREITQEIFRSAGSAQIEYKIALIERDVKSLRENVPGVASQLLSNPKGTRYLFEKINQLGIDATIAEFKANKAKVTEV